MKQLCVWVFRQLPFCRQFHLCSSNDFKEAALEILMATIFSIMPLWIVPAILSVVLRSEINLSDYLYRLIGGGELLVYCSAVAGPLIYIITRRYGEKITDDMTDPGTSRLANRFGYSLIFPHATTFVACSAFICLVAGVTFSLTKNPGLSNDAAKLNLEGIFWSSIVLYVFSLYCLFWASAYRNAIGPFLNGSDNSDNAPREEDSFADEWRAQNAG